MRQHLRFVLLFGWCALAPALAPAEEIDYEGREILLSVPDRLPAVGTRAMVVALHGGGGNARFMRSHLNLDRVAARNGFLVAYLNGTQAGRFTPEGMHAWNSGGGCCGQPARAEIDDIAYIEAAVRSLTPRYGINPARVYLTGHSNGAMMAQRLMCDSTLFAAAVTMSGPINPAQTACRNPHPGPILSIHGEADENVPVAGGKGTKGPMQVVREVSFRSEASAKAFFEGAGGHYTIHLVPGADHALAHLDEAITRDEGITLGDTIARQFGLE